MPGNVSDRQHKVDEARRDGVLRHGIELGLLGVLRDRQTALLLDSPEPEASIRASSRQNDPDAAMRMRIRQGLEEMIDRRAALAVFFNFRQSQMAVHGGEIAPGRDDINVVWLDVLIFSHLRDRHGRKRLQHLGHDAGLAGAQMNDNNKSQPAVTWQRRQQSLERLEPPGGGANPDQHRR
jgi:hypothetical protein